MYKLSIENCQNFLLGGKADFLVKDIVNKVTLNYLIKQDYYNKKLYYIKYKSFDWLNVATLQIKELIIDNVQINLPVFFPLNNVSDVKIIEKSNIINTIILCIYYIEQLPFNIEIHYTGRCSICGRKLTDEISINRGIGETCMKKIINKNVKNYHFK